MYIVWNLPNCTSFLLVFRFPPAIPLEQWSTSLELIKLSSIKKVGVNIYSQFPFTHSILLQFRLACTRNCMTHLIHNWIFVHWYHVAISRTEINDDTAERLQGFKESVKLDVECATTISGSLETAAVEKFIDILENCSGRVLVSGIGRYQGL